MRRTIGVAVLVLAGGATFLPAQPEQEEKLRFLRLTKERPVVEADFTIRRIADGWSIHSQTERGDVGLGVVARYGKDDELIAAEAILRNKKDKKSVAVSVADGKARVKREGQEAQEFDAPRGVIVTSAPDWSDTLLLCRRYDRARGGKQEFAGLWIHPEQPALRLTFTVERQGGDRIEHSGQAIELDRLGIQLRNNSRYTAWADAKGRMMKLVSVPTKDGASIALVLDGFEKATAQLSATKP